MIGLKFVVACVLLAALVSQTYAIPCYECSSDVAGNATCGGSTFDESNVNVTTGCTYCTTIAGITDGVEIVTRSCATAPTCEDASILGFTIKCCDTDLCNAVYTPATGNVTCYVCSSATADPGACGSSSVDTASASVSTMTDCVACATFDMVEASATTTVRSCATACTASVMTGITTRCCDTDLCNSDGGSGTGGGGSGTGGGGSGSGGGGGSGSGGDGSGRGGSGSENGATSRTFSTLAAILCAATLTARVFA